MTNRYPYRHHGPAVHGSKLADYLISEANMIEDIKQLRAENARLREALTRIDEASNHYAMIPTYSEGTLRYAHKSTRNLARAALSADLAPVGNVNPIPIIANWEAAKTENATRIKFSDPAPASSRAAAIKQRIADLEAENEEASEWGAAVAAREGELRGLRIALRAIAGENGND